MAAVDDAPPNLTRTVALVRAAHAPPTLAVTAVATALAVAAGRGSGAAWVALAVLAGQLSVGWCNDYADRDRDRAAGRQEKPIVAGAVRAPVVRVAAAQALVASVPLSVLSGVRAAVVHMVALALAWAYNLGLKSTPLSVLPYAVAFGLLPAFVTLGLPGAPWPAWWATTGAALLGAGAHFVNTVPDAAFDARTGVRGLPQRLGGTPSLRLGALLLLGACSVLALGPAGVGPGALAAVAVALACSLAVALAGQRKPRLAWQLTLATALLATALLLARGVAFAG